MDVNAAFEKYKILKTIKETAKYFNISAEGLRKAFIKNNIPYTKKLKYVCDETVFDKDNADSFYWAGFIAADGNISKQNDVSISLKLSDINHLYKFKKFIKSDTIVSEHIKKENFITINGKTHLIKAAKYARIRVRNNNIANSLIRFNLIPNKTKTYDIPDWILNHKLFSHFIRGYFDGDGWFSSTKRRMRFGICGNLPVIEKIKTTLLNCCNITGKPQLVKQFNIYKLTFSKQHDVSNIIDYIYKNAETYLDRKYELSKIAKQLDKDTIILNLNKEKLQDAYNRLKSIKLVAEEFGCCKSSISNYMKRYNIKTI